MEEKLPSINSPGNSILLIYVSCLIAPHKSLPRYYYNPTRKYGT